RTPILIRTASCYLCDATQPADARVFPFAEEEENERAQNLVSSRVTHGVEPGCSRPRRSDGRDQWNCSGCHWSSIGGGSSRCGQRGYRTGGPATDYRLVGSVCRSVLTRGSVFGRGQCLRICKNKISRNPRPHHQNNAYDRHLEAVRRPGSRGSTRRGCYREHNRGDDRRFPWVCHDQLLTLSHSQLSTNPDAFGGSCVRFEQCRTAWPRPGIHACQWWARRQQ